MTKTRIAGVLTLAAASTALAASIAVAGHAYPDGPGNNDNPFIGEGRVDIRISASPAITGGSTVNGVLASKRESCENGREVKLIHVVRNQSDEFVRSATSVSGAFQLNLNDKRGRYALHVTKRGDCNSRTEIIQP